MYIRMCIRNINIQSTIGILCICNKYAIRAYVSLLLYAIIIAAINTSIIIIIIQYFVCMCMFVSCVCMCVCVLENVFVLIAAYIAYIYTFVSRKCAVPPLAFFPDIVKRLSIYCVYENKIEQMIHRVCMYVCCTLH